MTPPTAATGRLARLAPFGTVKKQVSRGRCLAGSPLLRIGDRGDEGGHLCRGLHGGGRHVEFRIQTESHSCDFAWRRGCVRRPPKRHGHGLEFEAVSATVEFGYGRYLTQSPRSAEVQGMVAEILARRAMGECARAGDRGRASFVPVKNKRAYESNEQLAKMRAQKGGGRHHHRPVREGLGGRHRFPDRPGLGRPDLNSRGMPLPTSPPTATSTPSSPSGVNSWRNDGDWTHLRAMDRIDLNLPLERPLVF